MKEIPEGLSDEMTVETTAEMGAAHLPIPMYSTPTMVGHIEATLPEDDHPVPRPGRDLGRVPGRRQAHGADADRDEGHGEVEGEGAPTARRSKYEVEVYNETGAKIGEGTHERRVIDMTRFARPS